MKWSVWDVSPQVASSPLHYEYNEQGTFTDSVLTLPSPDPDEPGNFHTQHSAIGSSGKHTTAVFKHCDEVERQNWIKTNQKLEILPTMSWAFTSKVLFTQPLFLQASLNNAVHALLLVGVDVWLNYRDAPMPFSRASAQTQSKGHVVGH